MIFREIKNGGNIAEILPTFWLDGKDPGRNLRPVITSRPELPKPPQRTASSKKVPDGHDVVPLVRLAETSLQDTSPNDPTPSWNVTSYSGKGNAKHTESDSENPQYQKPCQEDLPKSLHGLTPWSL